MTANTHQTRVSELFGHHWALKRSSMSSSQLTDSLTPIRYVALFYDGNIIVARVKDRVNMMRCHLICTHSMYVKMQTPDLTTFVS